MNGNWQQLPIYVFVGGILVQYNLTYRKGLEGVGQRKGRLFQVIGLAGLRASREMTLQDLGKQMLPPVSKSYVGQLENGKAMASAATLMDLARIFGSVEIADEYGHRYVLVYRGHVPPAIGDSVEWPEPEPY